MAGCGTVVCRKAVVFAQFLPGERGLLNPSITRWDSVAISTHRVFRLADVHSQVMRYFPKPTSCY